mmetsp:Transcript_21631/g.44478  ORF Transcript_21631/g.44478 Transcript_21631/m.44478 type:complete len:124 (+) Transcript_21631:78-449(+)
MSILRNNIGSILLLFVAVCLGATEGFQPISSALSTKPSVRFELNEMPPQYDERDFEVDEGIPKLKIPEPKLSMPEFDFKEVLKKLAVLGATVLAFVAIQKLGLAASEVFTPELSPEQVRDFQL